MFLYQQYTHRNQNDDQLITVVPRLPAYLKHAADVGSGLNPKQPQPYSHNKNPHIPFRLSHAFITMNHLSTKYTKSHKSDNNQASLNNTIYKAEPALTTIALNGLLVCNKPSQNRLTLQGLAYKQLTSEVSQAFQTIETHPSISPNQLQKRNLVFHIHKI